MQGKTHNGLFLSKMSPVLETLFGTKLEESCSRCFRSTHITRECHAKYDVLNNLLPVPTNVGTSIPTSGGGGGSTFNSTFNSSLNSTINSSLNSKKTNNAARKLTDRVKNNRVGKKTIGPINKCRFYERGKCHRQDCPYSHNITMIIPTIVHENPNLCKFYRRGGCEKGSSCSFSHDKSKFPCAHYHKYRNCTKKDCEWDHGEMSEFQKNWMEMDQLEYENSSKLKSQ